MNRRLFAAASAASLLGAWSAVAAPTRTVWEGVYSKEQAARGQAVYRQACAGCHGMDLQGGSTAPGLVGESFSFLYDDSSVGELLTRVRTMMPPENANGLPSQSYRDIIAFLLSSNAFPAGTADLDADLALLKQIFITKTRPGQPALVSLARGRGAAHDQ
jgi:S-disulfanyl-L-cysteine oxidoreductase SoxD